MSIFENPKKVSKKTHFMEHCDDNEAETQKVAFFFVMIYFYINYRNNLKIYYWNNLWK